MSDHDRNVLPSADLVSSELASVTGGAATPPAVIALRDAFDSFKRQMADQASASSEAMMPMLMSMMARRR